MQRIMFALNFFLSTIHYYVTETIVRGSSNKISRGGPLTWIAIVKELKFIRYTYMCCIWSIITFRRCSLAMHQ